MDTVADHGIFSSLLITFQPVNFLACFIGAVIGTAGRSAAGAWSCGCHGPGHPPDAEARADRGPDHAGRDILRVHVWRIHNLDSRQCSRRACECRDHPGRLCHGDERAEPEPHWLLPPSGLLSPERSASLRSSSSRPSLQDLPLPSDLRNTLS